MFHQPNVYYLPEYFCNSKNITHIRFGHAMKITKILTNLISSDLLIVITLQALCYLIWSLHVDIVRVTAILLLVCICSQPKLDCNVESVTQQQVRIFSNCLDKHRDKILFLFIKLKIYRVHINICTYTYIRVSLLTRTNTHELMVKKKKKNIYIYLQKEREVRTSIHDDEMPKPNTIFTNNPIIDN